jgi:Cell Wall Hydrolase
LRAARSSRLRPASVGPLGLVKLIIEICLVLSKESQHPSQRKFHRYGLTRRKKNRASASGESDLLTHNIDFYPNDLTIEEKVFRGVKHLCIVFAVSAVMLSLFDLANIRTVESAAAFINDNRARVAELPNQIRSGIEYISYESELPSVTVMIPRDAFAKAAMPVAVAAAAAIKTQVSAKVSPVAALAASRHEDAVEFAMTQPAAKFKPDLAQANLTKTELRIAADPASSSALASEPIKLASVDMGAIDRLGSLPAEDAPAPVSLPMSAAIPLDMVPMPRAAPGVPPPSPAERLHLEGKNRVKAERCLANAIYFEARSEPVRGQMAVAQVVINRAFSGFYPNDICGVVYQNAGRHLACQFTFACDGKSKAINERGNWARANRIAKQTLDGQIYVPEVAKSTHYHAVYVHPNWVREMKKMVRFGVHNFYRPYAWGNGAEEPVWGSGVVATAKKN